MRKRRALTGCVPGETRFSFLFSSESGSDEIKCGINCIYENNHNIQKKYAQKHGFKIGYFVVLILKMESNTIKYNKTRRNVWIFTTKRWAERRKRRKLHDI